MSVRGRQAGAESMAAARDHSPQGVRGGQRACSRLPQRSTSSLYLPYISPISPLHLPYISPTSPLYLPYIWSALVQTWAEVGPLPYAWHVWRTVSVMKVVPRMIANPNPIPIPNPTPIPNPVPIPIPIPIPIPNRTPIPT